MVKIIFLDIDGVLNHRQWIINTSDLCSSNGLSDYEMLDPIAVARLNQIIKVTDAKVVISSSWRMIHGINLLRNFLLLRGFCGEVIDTTPPILFLTPRRKDIKSWLRTAIDIDNFVIFDDESDASIPGHFIKTDFETGLLDIHVEKAISILNSVMDISKYT